MGVTRLGTPRVKARGYFGLVRIMIGAMLVLFIAVGIYVVWDVLVAFIFYLIAMPIAVLLLGRNGARRD